ncbi:MAG TPA: rhomboid family intramembrane serine protease [Polyangiaceae bacterium]|nr:rhomboid family intramembrane serine protease [Polyangiaceae bacterium]
MLTPWVGRIIFANVIVYLAGMFVPGFDEYAKAWGALIPILLLSRPWTLVSYAFLHQGVIHIFFNMLVLFMFGPRVEMQLGPRKFVVLYFVSAIAGGLLSYTTPYVRIVGASGATFGVMYAFAKYWPKAQIYLFGFVPLEARFAVIAMVALELSGGIRGGGATGGDIVAHFAHLGGFVGAYVYLRLVDLRAPKARFQAKLTAQRASRDDLDRWAKIRREKMHEVNREEFDRIMEKIGKEGVGSVTPQERLFLDNFSERAAAET